MASNNIEIEAKVLLTKESYVKIVNALKLSGNVVTQTNYYLDSADRILKTYGKKGERIACTLPSGNCVGKHSHQ